MEILNSSMILITILCFRLLWIAEATKARVTFNQNILYDIKTLLQNFTNSYQDEDEDEDEDYEDETFLKPGDWIPVTPGGTPCIDLAASTEQEAIDNLLKEAPHMPYNGWDSNDSNNIGFKQRGYTIEQVTAMEPSNE